MLRRAKMLLILIDKNPRTVMLRYKLKPQFPTYLHNDFWVIQTVLKKMLVSMLFFKRKMKWKEKRFFLCVHIMGPVVE